MAVKVRRLRFSIALAMRASSKRCIPVKQADRHFDLMLARFSQVFGSMSVDCMLASGAAMRPEA